MSERYDYIKAVCDDVAEYIRDNVDLSDWVGNRSGLENYLNEELFNSDSVTGNASGSYYCNAWRAEEALSHNWELLVEAAECFCCEPVIGCGYENGAEYWDVTIRCYLLPGCISEVLDDMEEGGLFDEPETARPESDRAGHRKTGSADADREKWPVYLPGLLCRGKCGSGCPAGKH